MSNPVTYHRPTNLIDALALARQSGAIALAGGAATFGSLELPYQIVVDLQSIPELKRIEAGESNLYFGAGCSLQQVIETAEVPLVVRRSLTRAVPLNWRNGVSVGESLMQAAHFPEWLAVLTAHDAGVEYFSADQKAEVQAVSELLQEENPFASKIATGLHIPLLGHGEALGSAHIARTPADHPILCAAVFVQAEGDRVEMAFASLGAGSAAPHQRLHLTALEGQPFSDDAIQGAAAAASAGLNLGGDHLASAAYRQAMAPVLLRRALEDCRDFLRSGL
jgi:CO/xanthine dehydrogenase FAD-binding subunit